MAISRENTKKWLGRFLPIPLFLLVGYGSYWLTVRSLPEKETPPIASEKREIPLVPQKRSFSPENKRKPSEEQAKESVRAEELKQQRAITFKDEEAMRRFLAKLGEKVQLLGKIDALNTVLVGFGNSNDLDALLEGDEELSMIFPIEIPSFENVGPQDGAVALNNSLLKWLGVESDNALWGKGLVIAVLDTGIADHMVFKNPIQRINLVPLPSDLSLLNGHGTAVASLIFSSNPSAPGVAPAATPLSVRIADDSGYSNSFLIAQGIVAAVDAGAHIINISMGGTGNSTLVDQALAYAKQNGVVVVAAAGNTGADGVLQPAAHPSVIAVGSVDAKNQPMNFSTSGNEVAISSPGFGIYAAYPGDQAASVTGTSFSTPIVTGVLAAVASSSGRQTMSAQQAADLILNNLTDVGTFGDDPNTGGGVPDLGAIMNAGDKGRYDVSVNSIYLTDNNQLQVLVQNLGTETLINTGLSVNINGTNFQSNVTTLAPMETRVISIPVNQSESFTVSGTAQVTSGQTDVRMGNNSLSVQIVPNP
jgi:hypothetical protein